MKLLDLGGIVLYISLSLLGCNNAPDTSAVTQSPDEAIVQVPVVEKVILITQEELKKVRYGMTLLQVETTLKRHADRHESVYDKGIEGYTQPFITIWYFWDNTDNSVAKIGFVNDKVAEKEWLSREENQDS